MKPELFKLYNALKGTFAGEIKKEIDKKGGKVVINKEIPIFADGVLIETENIQNIETVDDDGVTAYLVQCFCTDAETLEVVEIWNTLDDFPMDELYAIAEVL